MDLEPARVRLPYEAAVHHGDAALTLGDLRGDRPGPYRGRDAEERSRSPITPPTPYEVASSGPAMRCARASRASVKELTQTRSQARFPRIRFSRGAGPTRS